jgi:hypothetical protein
MEKLIARVKDILAKEFGDATVELEQAQPARKVAGSLVWSGFEGMEQIERQDRLWKAIEKGLAKDEQLQITLILTLTPRELAVSKEA